MGKTQTNNGNNNGAKPIWERPIEKGDYTEDELELIRTTRAVLKVIHKQKEEGVFDEILNKENTKV